MRHGVKTDEGAVLTSALVTSWLDQETDAFRQQLGPQRYAASKYDAARDILRNTIQGREYDDFLTTACYDSVLTLQPQSRM